MPGFIGRKTAVGLAKETTRGTAVSPEHWLRLTDFDFDDQNEVIARTGRQALIEQNYGGDVIKKWAEGSLQGNITSDGFGLILLQMLGSASTSTNADPSGNVYDHTFSVDNSNTHQSLTVTLDDPEVGDKQYTNVIGSSLEIAAAQDAYATFNAGMMGNAETDGTESPSFSTEQFFRPQDISFKHASDKSSLGGASKVDVRSVTVNIEKNPEGIWNLGSQSATEFYNKAFAITLDLELIHQDDTFRDYFMGGDSRALQVDMTNQSQTIGDSANPSLTLEFAEAQLTDWSRSLPSDDLSTETMTWRIDYNSSNSEMIDAVLTNTTTSY